MGKTRLSHDTSDKRAVLESFITYLEDGFHVACLPWDVSKDLKDLKDYKNPKQEGILFSLTIDMTDSTRRFIDFLKKELELINDQ